MRRLLLLAFGLALLSGCGAQPDSGFRGIAVCGTDTVPVIRVDPDLCPIGDGDVPGYGFKWYYEEYPHHPFGIADDIDYPLVNQPINTVVFVRSRPVGWGSSALTVYRDVPLTCGCTVAPGAPPVTHARLSRTQVSTLTKDDARRVAPAPPTRDIQRGGFGVSPNNRPTSGPGGKAGTAPAGKRPAGTSTSNSSGSKSKGGK